MSTKGFKSPKKDPSSHNLSIYRPDDRKDDVETMEKEDSATNTLNDYSNGMYTEETPKVVQSMPTMRGSSAPVGMHHTQHSVNSRGHYVYTGNGNEDKEPKVTKAPTRPAILGNKSSLNAGPSSAESAPSSSNQIPYEQAEDYPMYSKESSLELEEADSSSKAPEEGDESFSATHKIKKRGRPRNPPGTEPGPNSKIRISDPTAPYRCYIPECHWRGGYRSIRSDHMKWCHKDWKMPPRYLLHRASKEGIPIEPEPFEPEYSCLVDGCLWKGNFRASRSTHMRTVHPEYQPMRKKAPTGGFMPDGKYLCHEPTCGWRGASRSTRAAHMKKQHPGYVNPVYSQRNLPCCDCKEHLPSHKAFVDHMVVQHRIGGIVQREFSDCRDYEEWFDAVQESFSVEFIKRMGIKQTEQYQVLYLYCSRSGGYRAKRMRSNHSFISEYAKRRNFRSYNKCGRNCAAFLRTVHWTNGRLSVIGCVEHTGHRMGTSLLRLSPAEREVMDEYLYVQDDDTPLEMMIERLRNIEGYTADGFDVLPRSTEDVAIFIKDPINELQSLATLITDVDQFPPDSLFNVHLGDIRVEPWQEGFTFGIMTEEMKTLFRECSSRVVCIEEVRLMISHWDVSLSFVLVFDASATPRCACVYISQLADKQPLLKHLRSISNGPFETIVTDCSPEWSILFEQAFGESAYNADVQIAEWHLLSEWANQVDQLVHNKVDRFAILCALRRWLRASEPTLFEGMIIDMFEAFREMELDELAQTLDAQLTDPEYAKRWTPLNRNQLTEHSNPTLEIACRMFRERYLNCEICGRIDEYIGLLMQRIHEFNRVEMSDVYATGVIEPPRVVPEMYEDVDPEQVMADGSLAEPSTSGHSMMGHPNDPKNMIYRMNDEEPLHEEIVEEEQIIDMHDIQILNSSDLDELRSPSTQPSEGDRKERMNMLMERLKQKIEASDESAMEMMERSLSRVVDTLDNQMVAHPVPDRKDVNRM